MSLSTGRRGRDGCSSDGSGPPPHLVSPVSALDDRAPGVGRRRWPRAPGPTGLGRGEGSCPAPPHPLPTAFHHRACFTCGLTAWPPASQPGVAGGWAGARGQGRLCWEAGGARLILMQDPPLGLSGGPPHTDPGQTLGWPPAQGDHCGLCPPGCRSRGSWGRSEGRAPAAGQARGHSRSSWGRS